MIADRIAADRATETVGIDYCRDVDDPSAGLEALTVADTLADEAALGRNNDRGGAVLWAGFSTRCRKIYALVVHAIREADGDIAEAQRLT